MCGCVCVGPAAHILAHFKLLPTYRNQQCSPRPRPLYAQAAPSVPRQSSARHARSEGIRQYSSGSSTRQHAVTAGHRSGLRCYDVRGRRPTQYCKHWASIGRADCCRHVPGGRGSMGRPATSAAAWRLARSRGRGRCTAARRTAAGLAHRPRTAQSATAGRRRCRTDAVSSSQHPDQTADRGQASQVHCFVPRHF